MPSRAKIRLDSIEQVHRALEALPEHRPEELTKTQAIQRLIAPIRATQSKGYSLAAISKMLSEHGIPIAAGALRAYVSEADASAGGKKRHKAKRAVKTGKPAQPGATKGSQHAAPAQAPVVKTKSNAAGDGPSVDLHWDDAGPDNATSSGSDKRAQSGAGRPPFPVRPDTRDI